MGVKNKGRRRLLMLLAAAVIGTGSLGGWVLVRRQMLTAGALRARETGMAMAKAGDYPHALEQLGKYVSRFPNDKEALFEYATARQSVEMPNYGHLWSAIGAWKQLVAVDPENVEAHRKLMGLYQLIGYNAERLEEATTLRRLTTDATILNETWRAEAGAYFGMHKVPQAVKAIATATEKDPTNLEGRQLALRIMLANGATMEDLVKYTADLVAKYPNDPNFEILQADAYLQVAQMNRNLGAVDKSKEWVFKAAGVIKGAAAHDINDVELLGKIVLRLDMVGEYEQSLRLCARAAEAHKGDAAYRRVLVMRVFQAGNFDGVLTEVGGLDAADGKADGELLVMKAMALLKKGKGAEAGAVLEALAKRGAADKQAGALAGAVRAVWVDKDGDPAGQVEACRQAVAAAPGSAAVHYFLGEALQRAGETELAVRQWGIATELAPGWSMPFMRVARVRMDQGQLEQAVVMAEAARDRAHENREEQVLFATVCAQAYPKAWTLQLKVILDLCVEVEKKFPEALEIYPAHAHMLAQLDRREEAVAVVKGVIGAQRLPDAETLLRLALVSQADGLGLESACFELNEKTYGLTPELAFAKARWMLGAGKGAEGLAYMKQAAAGKGGVEWRVVEARYLDMVKDPGGKAAWVAAIAAFPKDLRVLRAAMASPAVRPDHDLMGKTIDQVRGLVGADNVETQLARAQWLLQGEGGKEPSDKDVAEATAVLSDVTRASPDLLGPRLMLAACMERLKNVSGAVEQLRAAADLAPKAAPRMAAGITMNLARLLLSQGEAAAARQQLTQVDAKDLSAAERQQLAGLLVRTRDFAAATQLMEAAADNSAGYLMLGQLYYTQGQLAKVDALAKKILADTKADVGALLFVAEYYGTQGRLAEAEQVLGRLKALEIAPAVRDAAVAEYLSHHGSTEDALAQLLVAARSAEGRPEGWRALLIYCFSKGRLDDVMRYLPEAVAAGSDPAMTVLNANRGLLKNFTTDPMVPLLCAGLMQSPADAPAIGEAMAILSDSALVEKPDQMLLRLRPLADRNPTNLSVQLLVVQNYMMAGQRELGITMAQRVMKAFPGSPQAAELAYRGLMTAARWPEALEVAKEWRQRLGQNSVAGDLGFARALMATGKVDEGMAIIQPMVPAARKNPDENSEVLVLYCQGLIAKKQANAAAAELEPLLKSTMWRSAWISLAATMTDKEIMASWLERIQKSIPADGTGELAQLAIQWAKLTKDTGNPVHLQHAVSLFDSLVKMPKVDASILFLAGTLAEQGGKAAMAEELYRRSLAATPDNDTRAMTSNNLAMVLVNTNDQTKLPEAMDLINVSVKLAPKFANFYDTKATVSAAAKGYKEGMAAIEEAIKIEPSNPEWRATKIWLLGLMGDKTRAQVEYQQMKLLNVKTLSPDSQKRLTEAGVQ